MLTKLPDETGQMLPYQMSGKVIPNAILPANSARVIYSAAHVVADPFADADPSGKAELDWEATLAFRRHLAGLGLGIAEAMDTAQRGMGLDWETALELITRTRADLPDALIANGCGTDHLVPGEARNLDDVTKAYLHQLHAIQTIGGRIILMASRELARLADGPDDYVKTYARVLAEADHPVILHWLGEMFDPALKGYWGSEAFDKTLETVLKIIGENQSKVDGIKISLLDKDKEIALRTRLPGTVKMYTGDDFNYPELIESGSHALLGIFDPLAPAAAFAVKALTEGDAKTFRATLDPTVPLARTIFRNPTRHYKTGVVFLAWLNGFQQHFIMPGGAQAMRSLPYFVTVFKQADACGLLADPDRAVSCMKQLMGNYGL
jgi:hypothetical protein